MEASTLRHTWCRNDSHSEIKLAKRNLTVVKKGQQILIQRSQQPNTPSSSPECLCPTCPAEKCPLLLPSIVSSTFAQTKAKKKPDRKSRFLLDPLGHSFSISANEVGMTRWDQQGGAAEVLPSRTVQNPPITRRLLGNTERSPPTEAQRGQTEYGKQQPSVLWANWDEDRSFKTLHHSNVRVSFQSFFRQF